MDNLLPPDRSVTVSKKTVSSFSRKIQKIAPPAWASAGVLSLIAIWSADPVLAFLSGAVWMVLLSTFAIAKINRTYKLGLQMRHRPLVVSLQALLVSLFYPFSPVFAQAAGGACATAGFLSDLTTFATQVLSPATSTGITSGALQQLDGFMCTVIGVFVLMIILLVVGSLAYVAYQVIGREEQIQTFGRPVGGLLFFVVVLIGFVKVATTAVLIYGLSQRSRQQGFQSCW